MLHRQHHGGTIAAEILREPGVATEPRHPRRPAGARWSAATRSGFQPGLRKSQSFTRSRGHMRPSSRLTRSTHGSGFAVWPSMTTLVAFLFVIGVIVLVHELGHFVVARRCGVRVEVFSIGFGPKLLTFRRHETDYCVSAIPLGGYIKMAGERPGAPLGDDGFLSKSKWQRCQILAAGPAMNLLLAATVVAAIAISGIENPMSDGGPAVVGQVIPGSPAARAGIRDGDEIVSVSGQATATWSAVDTAVAMRPN